MISSNLVHLFPLAAAIVALALILCTANAKQLLRTVVGALMGLNGVGVIVSLAALAFALGVPMPVLAESAEAAGVSSGAAMGAALSTGLACIGAGIAVGIGGAAAIGAITEKPEVLGRTLIFVGLAEGIAIYGLIISFMILNG